MHYKVLYANEQMQIDRQIFRQIDRWIDIFKPVFYALYSFVC